MKRDPLVVSLLLLSAGVVAFFLHRANAQDAFQTNVKRWQHLALEHPGAGVTGDQKLAGKIEELGNSGWELVDVATIQKDGSTTKTVYFYKRPR